MIPESDPDNHLIGIDSHGYCKFEEKHLSERRINENIYPYATNVPFLYECFNLHESFKRSGNNIDTGKSI